MVWVLRHKKSGQVSLVWGEGGVHTSRWGCVRRGFCLEESWGGVGKAEL